MRHAPATLRQCAGTSTVGRIWTSGANDPLKPTPLHCAVASGHKAVVELLLARGVDINAKRADGLTALDIVLKVDPDPVTRTGRTQRVSPVCWSERGHGGQAQVTNRRSMSTPNPVRCAMAVLFSGAFGLFGATNQSLRVATFDVDATPPLGYMMAYDPVIRVDAMTLRCRGVVLLGQAKPIVLCAVDWLGSPTRRMMFFCERLAKAAGTTPERVAVHTLHQHDAPVCDFLAERLLKEAKAKKPWPSGRRFLSANPDQGRSSSEGLSGQGQAGKPLWLGHCGGQTHRFQPPHFRVGWQGKGSALYLLQGSGTPCRTRGSKRF
ncbi:MAG: hypothetical protein CM1200mP29_06260 [Verrucomicrobiota bacterium]|nr:MAG: hypothetical protein CM1200mP29_06260 [Verrucomicrobiota bacterium]